MCQVLCRTARGVRTTTSPLMKGVWDGMSQTKEWIPASVATQVACVLAWAGIGTRSESSTKSCASSSGFTNVKRTVSPLTTVTVDGWKA